jgi:hypothetical protein
MSNFKIRVKSFTGFEDHQFVNISEIDKISNEQLNIVKERIIDNSKILHEKQVTVYFRPSNLLEVFILVDHTLSEDEAEFWYKVICKIKEGFDENIFKIGVGDPKLWIHISKRFGWKKFDIY